MTCDWSQMLYFLPNLQIARQAMYVLRNIEARSRNHCHRGKAESITCSECVSLALVIQHAKRMRRIIVSSVACPSLFYFCTLPRKRHNFWEKVLNSKCLF